MSLKSQHFFLIFSSLLILVNSALSSEFVPVYLWQTAKSSRSIPALPRVSTDTFGEVLRERLDKDTILVVFAEPNLSPEDFNAVAQSGERAFAQLAKVRKDASTIYLPQVQKPIDAISKLFDDEVATVSAKNFKLENVGTSALIIDLNDVQDDEDRNHMLARHDKIVVDIHQQLMQKYSNVVILLTGRQASWVAPKEVLNRKVRDIEPRNNSNAWKVQHPQLLIYATDTPTLHIDGKEEKLATDYTVDLVNTDGENMTMELTSVASSSDVITIVFSFKGGYWSFVSLKVARNGSTYDFKVPTSLYPPSTFSYQCTREVFVMNASKSNSLTFKNLQIQPFAAPQQPVKFGDPYFCVGFTSPAIWSGIFIAFLLATIMAIGLLMMMDMKTMDRFDDPKGKTIIINATD